MEKIDEKDSLPEILPEEILTEQNRYFRSSRWAVIVAVDSSHTPSQRLENVDNGCER